MKSVCLKRTKGRISALKASAVIQSWRSRRNLVTHCENNRENGSTPARRRSPNSGGGASEIDIRRVIFLPNDLSALKAANSVLFLLFCSKKKSFQFGAMVASLLRYLFSIFSAHLSIVGTQKKLEFSQLIIITAVFKIVTYSGKEPT